jgi:hypothetical protein
MELIKLSNITSIKSTVDDLIERYPQNKIDPKEENISTSQHGDQYILSQFLNNELKKISDDIKSIIENRYNCKLKAGSCWAVYGHEWCWHDAHQHSNTSNGISSVIYLTNPIKTEQEKIDRRGCFYWFEFDIFQKLELKIHHPTEGDVLFFPNTIFHGTFPQSKGLRQTLNIDFDLI